MAKIVTKVTKRVGEVNILDRVDDLSSSRDTVKLGEPSLCFVIVWNVRLMSHLFLDSSSNYLQTADCEH